MVILETERLILRPPELADAPAIQRLVSAREIAATTLRIPYPYPDDGAESWIRRVTEGMAENPFRSFVITRRDDGALLGNIGIHPDMDHKHAEIGYWVGVPYWGQGYATEAARRVVCFGFEEMGLNRIFASYFSENVASRRVMEKCGMTYEGTMRQHILKWERFVDLGTLSILRSEWERG